MTLAQTSFIVAVIFLGVTKSLEFSWWRLFARVAAIVLMALAAKWAILGRREEAADDLMQSTTDTAGKVLSELTVEDFAREPASVLYVRSFSDDERTERTTNREPISQTEEEQTMEVLSSIGTIAAIGRPGEELPRLGARRIYVPDALWKAVVLVFMTRCELVVLRLGASSGLMWELREAIARVPPRRLLLLSPLNSYEYRTFRERTAELFPKGIPEDYPRWHFADGSVWCAIWFDDNWHPQLGRVKWNFFTDGTASAVKTSLSKTLEPVLTRIGATMGDRKH